MFRGGRWRWRACITARECSRSGVVSTRQRVGPLRESQREAFDDVDALRAKAAAASATVGPRGPTVLEALSAAIQAKIDQGLAPHSVTGDVRTPARAVLRRFRGGALLETITPDVLRRWVREQIDAGVAPSTVRKKRLAVLHLAFRSVGLPSPVPEVLDSLRQLLRPRDVEVPSFSVEELAELLAAVRAWRSPHGRPTPRRELDVLLIELVATTGIRHDELARIRKGDVWLDQGVIVVRPKVRRRTRQEPIVPEVLERLRARMAELEGEPDETPLVPGYGTEVAGQAPWYPQAKYLARVRERWKTRLDEARFHFRALRRGHGTALDHLGAPFAVVRDALGHTRTSNETTRYLGAGQRAVTAAKRSLATHLLPPLAPGPEVGPDEHAQGREPLP